jgi:DNA-binding GntR family transcriptional regulator
VVTPAEVGQVPGAGLALSRQTTGEEVAGVLRELVMSGELEPGAPLREAALSQRFEVSRRTVRDALAILEREGLARHHRHRGAFVTQFGAADIIDLYRVRRTMELAAAQQAPHASAAARAALDDAFARLADATRLGRASEIVLRDLNFHRAVVGLLGSDRFDRFFAEISVEMRYALSILESSYQESAVRPAEALDEHRAMYAALRDGDGATAAALIDEHVRDNQALLLRAIAAVPDPAGA